MTLAALVLGSSLVAGAPETGPDDQPAVAPLQESNSEEQAAITPAAARRAEKIRRRRLTMLKLHTIGGVALEVSSTALHALTAAWLIDDAKEGYCAPDMPCKGTPVVLFVPVGAVATGWIGATRLAAAREASIWRSPMFWGGTAVSVLAPLVAASIRFDRTTQNGRLSTDAVLVAGLVSGTALQMWGAFLAPPREVKIASRSPHLGPGCGPTAGGVVCGLALAGF